MRIGEWVTLVAAITTALVSVITAWRTTGIHTLVNQNATDAARQNEALTRALADRGIQIPADPALARATPEEQRGQLPPFRP